MPRLHLVDREEAGSELITQMYDYVFGSRDPVHEPGTATGTSGDWWPAFANSPDIFEHAMAGFRVYRSKRRVLDPVLRELGQTRAGWTIGSKFVFSQHCKSLRGLGQSEERIEAIAHWQVASCFTELERAVLAYADYLTYDRGRVPDAVYDYLHDQLGDVALLELTYITTLYAQHAVMSRALRTEYDDVDEPVVEVPAPERGAAAGLDIAPPEDDS